MNTNRDKNKHRSALFQTKESYRLEGNVDALDGRLQYLNEQYSLKKTFNFDESKLSEEEYKSMMKVSKMPST